MSDRTVIEGITINREYHEVENQLSTEYEESIPIYECNDNDASDEPDEEEYRDYIESHNDYLDNLVNDY